MITHELSHKRMWTNTLLYQLPGQKLDGRREEDECIRSASGDAVICIFANDRNLFLFWNSLRQHFVGSSFKYFKYDFFDGIEMFVSEDETAYFPFHLHDYFCLSLITRGTELLQTQNAKYYATAGMLSITQANEAHRNCSLNDSGYSYQTIYIHPELLRYYNNGSEVGGLQRVIEDRKIADLFTLLTDQQPHAFKIVEQIIKKLLFYRRAYAQQKVHSFDLMDELIASIGLNRLSLDQMADYFCMSKYHFIRRFKEANGITPQVYVALQRLRNAKKMLLQGEEIKTAAFLNGFYDATHLNAAFKRYFGVGALAIKNSNIIHSGE
ncbi:AraC family transcriptional regulator [Mucilaginibacter calamicampi]|uniref:AraC family transcriptional regulator n=1 Tax=Mucilaginibacter calamicampi TaxID=1302352 RepID=A0ABW2YT20_9SPHI